MELDNLGKINWNYITAGLDYYRKAGFKYIEVPWIVPEDIARITFKGDSRFTTEAGWLVGSGEQSFLHLSLNKKLSPGRYMTITPCFRDETEDSWHQKQFLKLELYITDLVCAGNLYKTINLCQEFFEDNLFESMNDFVFSTTVLKQEVEDGSFDVICEGIELGSYGIREHLGHSWIYGTGVAEPRMSQVQQFIFPDFDSKKNYERL